MRVIELQIRLQEQVIGHPVRVCELVVAIQIVCGFEELPECLLLDLGEGEDK